MQQLSFSHNELSKEINVGFSEVNKSIAKLDTRVSVLESRTNTDLLSEIKSLIEREK